MTIKVIKVIETIKDDTKTLKLIRELMKGKINNGSNNR